jgi:hypothetical protein
MKRRWIVACALAALAALAGSAAAEPKMQVLQSDGRASAKVRAKIDASILALAKTSGAQVIPGDITFTDAATAVGCTAHDAACKNEVLGMLSVDEIVITTVSPKPGGFEVAVRRVGKGGASREATSFVAQGKLDKLDTIAPLFSTRPAPSAPTPSPAPARPFGPQPAPPSTTTSPPGALTTGSPQPPSEIAPGASAPQALTEPRTSPIETQPSDPYAAGKDDRPRGSRLPLFGMAGGATMALVGLIFWGSAASVQSEIDAAPVGTKAQLRALQELEARGDGYAAAGNLFVVGGLVLGGVSTYYFVKSRRRAASSTARLVPTVFEGGGGLAIAIGGMP